MTDKFKACAAAVLAAAVLCGCAAGKKTPVSSGDIPSGTVPITTEPTSEQAAESLNTPDSQTSPSQTDPTDTTPPESDPEASSSDGFSVTSLSTVLYAIDILNVREQPSTEAKVVGQLNPGDEAIVTGLTSSGWYRLDYNGGIAFAFGEYLSSERPIVSEERPNVPENYYFDSADDYFFVVNKDNFLPEDYAIETDFVQGSYELEIVAAYYCRAMIDAAEKDGIDLKVLSAYRTVEYQQKLFDRNVKARMEESGMTYEQAYEDVAVNIAPPGGSEHNAGLAVDIIDKNHWDTYEEFENTKEFEWLSEHCTEYGFILRYPKGKENVTGYVYEPWHYRYVGTKYAEEVTASGLCLEEYV